jgi:hypothetical protein
MSRPEFATVDAYAGYGGYHRVKGSVTETIALNANLDSIDD